jgi:sodium transport system ATP-binding protein
MVEYFGRLNGMEAALLDERMEALFERLKMNEIRDLLGSKMSTGMKQKVSIARAIVHDPPVVIFDEPTNGLDVLVARALLETVIELRDHLKCIVFSTHIMREAEKLCDRIAIVHRGQLLAEGSLAQLQEKYAEKDLEELFFRLISQSERDEALSPRSSPFAPSA